MCPAVKIIILNGRLAHTLPLDRDLSRTAKALVAYTRPIRSEAEARRLLELPRVCGIAILAHIAPVVICLSALLVHQYTLRVVALLKAQGRLAPAAWQLTNLAKMYLHRAKDRPI